MGASEVSIPGLTPLLQLERQVLVRRGPGLVKEATIILRGDETTQFGLIQEVIQVCQDVGFERFAMRAKQQEVRSQGISR